jgi:dihydrofolate synthase / folylpolyglutamate synthase
VNYRESLDFLYSRGNEVKDIHLGLTRIRTLMRELGNPHEEFAVLHIAGTNGKGSVAAMAESILRHAGWRTGLFTSPHLRRIEERIRVNGREISPRAFARRVSRVRSKEEGLLREQRIDHLLTFFELVTACAFLHFLKTRVQVAVIEVGLGGRLDATNIVSPRACVITGISYDHQNLLGKTLGEIAREKAGIVKPGVPFVSGCTQPVAKRVLREQADRVGAPILEIDRQCAIRITGKRQGHYSMDFETPRSTYRNLRLSIAGRFQVRNAALAIAAVEALADGPASRHAVRRGLATTRWPGRLDEYQAQRRTLLDGAHNPEAVQLLRDHLEQENLDPVYLVFGAMSDKNLSRMGKLLFPMARSIHLARISNSRSAEPRVIAALHRRFRSRIHLHVNARSALEAAWKECPRDGIVVVTGSLYLLGEVLPLVEAAVKQRKKLTGSRATSRLRGVTQDSGESRRSSPPFLLQRRSL